MRESKMALAQRTGEYSERIAATRHPQRVLTALHQLVHPEKINVLGAWLLPAFYAGRDAGLVEVENLFFHHATPRKFWSGYKRLHATKGPSAIGLLAQHKSWAFTAI